MQRERRRENRLRSGLQAHDGPSNSWSRNVSRGSFTLKRPRGIFRGPLFGGDFSQSLIKQFQWGDSILCVLCAAHFFSWLRSYCNRCSIACADKVLFPSLCCLPFACELHLCAWRISIFNIFFNNYTFSAAPTASHTLTIRGIRDRWGTAALEYCRKIWELFVQLHSRGTKLELFSDTKRTDREMCDVSLNSGFCCSSLLLFSGGLFGSISATWNVIRQLSHSGEERVV